MTRNMFRLTAGPILCATILGCDGYLATRGHVYASLRADTSRIYVDEPFPSTAGLVQIDSASVWVFQRAQDQTFDTTRSVPFSYATLSGPCGYFSTGEVAPPAKFDAAISVQRSGFKSVARRFRHESVTPHRVLIVLAPLPNTVIAQPASTPECP